VFGGVENDNLNSIALDDMCGVSIEATLGFVARRARMPVHLPAQAVKQ
jgi:hypothetical protein